MSKKTRRILFLLAIGAFLVIGFIATMYAQGYRWDFKTNKFLLSGGIYLKSEQKTADIFLNDKYLGQQTPYLIKNLLPFRKYKIKLTKDGFKPWEKEFEITPGSVSEAIDIMLWPDKLNNQIVWSDLEPQSFSVSPDQKFLALQKGNNKLVISRLLSPSATSSAISFPDKKRATSVGFLENGAWTNNTNKFIFWREIYSSALRTPLKDWYIWDGENKSLISLNTLYERKMIIKNALTSPLPTRFTPNKISWFGNDNTIIVLMNGRLLQLDIKNENIIDLNVSDALDFDTIENKIVVLKKPDILLLLDSSIQNISALGQAKFPPQKILISPDGLKVAYFNANAIGTLWQKDTSEQPLRKLGEQEIIFESSQKLTNIEWHASSEHILFLADNKLTLAELDNRGQRNIFSWPEMIKTFVYLPGARTLYSLGSNEIKIAENKF